MRRGKYRERERVKEVNQGKGAFFLIHRLGGGCGNFVFFDDSVLDYSQIRIRSAPNFLVRLMYCNV